MPMELILMLLVTLCFGLPLGMILMTRCTVLLQTDWEHRKYFLKGNLVLLEESQRGEIFTEFH